MFSLQIQDISTSKNRKVQNIKKELRGSAGIFICFYVKALKNEPYKAAQTDFVSLVSFSL